MCSSIKQTRKREEIRDGMNMLLLGTDRYVPHRIDPKLNNIKQHKNIVVVIQISSPVVFGGGRLLPNCNEGQEKVSDQNKIMMNEEMGTLPRLEEEDSKVEISSTK